MEKLARMRGHYTSLLHEKDGGQMKKNRRTAARMDNDTPINENTIREIEDNIEMEAELTSTGEEFRRAIV